jgi:SAM-dependent methyltransferase
LETQHDYIRQHYAPRAHDYLTSPTHATGADLDQIAASVARWQPARVLDLGCGGGHVAYRVAALAGEVVAADLTQDMLDLVRETAATLGLANLRTQRAAAEALPFPGAAFDAVLCRYSAHHWGDLDAGLREARRVLTPSGRALFVDSVAPARPLLDTHLQTIELLRDASHVRNYTAAEWVAACGRAGFRLVGLTPRRLRMEFAAWVARTRTTPARVAALQAVQHAASQDVRRHFEIEPDASWLLDTLAVGLESA